MAKQMHKSFSLDPTVRQTVWAALLGISTQWLYPYGFTQAGVQRMAATKSENDARLTILMNIPFQIVSTSILYLTGLVVYASYFKTRCDPLKSGRINNPNQILPHFTLKVFESLPGLPGLFIATLYGGALSSVSSSLSGAAAMTWVDIVKPRVPNWSDYKGAVFNKLMVVLYGVLSMGVSFAAATFPGPITQVSQTILGGISGPVSGLFLMGGLLTFVNWLGAAAGSTCGFLVVAWLIIGGKTDGSAQRRNPPLPPGPLDGCLLDSNTTTLSSIFSTLNPTFPTTSYATANVSDKGISGLSNFYALSFYWYSAVGITITMLVGILVSCVSRLSFEHQDVDEKLLIKFRQNVCYPRNQGQKSTVYEFSSKDEMSTSPALNQEKGGQVSHVTTL